MAGRTVSICKRVLVLSALVQLGRIKGFNTNESFFEKMQRNIEKIAYESGYAELFMDRFNEIQLVFNQQLTLLPEIIYTQNQHNNSNKQEHDQEKQHNNHNNKKDKKNDEDQSKEDGSGSSESESESDSDDEDDRNGGITIPVLEWVKGIFPRIVPLPQSNS